MESELGFVERADELRIRQVGRGALAGWCESWRGFGSVPVNQEVMALRRWTGAGIWNGVVHNAVLRSSEMARTAWKGRGTAWIGVGSPCGVQTTTWQYWYTLPPPLCLHPQAEQQWEFVVPAGFTTRPANVGAGDGPASPLAGLADTLSRFFSVRGWAGDGGRGAAVAGPGAQGQAAGAPAAGAGAGGGGAASSGTGSGSLAGILPQGYAADYGAPLSLRDIERQLQVRRVRRVDLAGAYGRAGLARPVCFGVGLWGSRMRAPA